MYRYTEDAINGIDDHLPAVYKIYYQYVLVYVGSAKAGRVRDRLKEHLRAGYISGDGFDTEQFDTVEQARSREEALIVMFRPMYNKQHT